MTTLPLSGGSGEKKWELADGVAECKRELKLRERVYPAFIERKSLDPHSAAKQVKALQGTLRFLEFCAKHELRLRALLEEHTG
jgi:hypothetical protein